MKLIAYIHARDFLERVRPLLLAREAENNLVLGIVARLADGALPAVVGGAGQPRYWLMEKGDNVIAAAVMTPPHRLLLTRLPAEAVEPFAQQLHAGGVAIPGAMGPRESTDAFVASWRRLRSCSTQPHHTLRLYQLDRVADLPAKSGAMSPAQVEEMQLLQRWIDGFRADTGVRERPTEQILRGQIIAGFRFVWKDPQPVSMAALAGPTPNGIRIGAVYTPPEFRGCGYATALVAALSRQQLEAGRNFCFLFADLANATSNSIYPRIGYQPVCDFQEYDFG